jgi:hypothetical protein
MVPPFVLLLESKMKTYFFAIEEHLFRACL